MFWLPSVVLCPLYIPVCLSWLSRRALCWMLALTSRRNSRAALSTTFRCHANYQGLASLPETLLRFSGDCTVVDPHANVTIKRVMSQNILDSSKAIDRVHHITLLMDIPRRVYKQDLPGLVGGPYRPLSDLVSSSVTYTDPAFPNLEFHRWKAMDKASYFMPAYKPRVRGKSPSDDYYRQFLVVICNLELFP